MEPQYYYALLAGRSQAPLVLARPRELIPVLHETWQAGLLECSTMLILGFSGTPISASCKLM